jgi:hypothetical protein
LGALKPARIGLFSKIAATTAGVAAAFALTGCGSGNVAGSGNKPDHIVIEMVQNKLATLTPGSIYQCQLAQMHAIIVFTDGSKGDFSSRVTWSTTGSSGSGDTQVSNGTLPVNPDDVTEGSYAIGVLIPGNTGTTTVIADYQGLVGRFDMTILPADPSTFSFADGSNHINSSIDGTFPSQSSFPRRFQSNYLKAPITQPQTGTLWLGAGTNYAMEVLAPLNGVETNVSSFARWDFVNGGDTSEVTVSALGGLSALRAGGAQTLRARFPGCSTEMTMPVAVSNIQSLSIEQDPVLFDTNKQAYQSLLVGNLQRLGIFADLGIDTQGRAIPKQDVSSSTSFWVSDSSVMSFTQQGGGGAYMQAGAVGTVNMQATGIFGNQAQVQSPIVQMSTTSGNLSGLSLSLPSADALLGFPAGCQLGTVSSPELQTGSACYSPFTATGSYVLNDGSSLSQDVTLLATWSLSDSTVATIAGGAPAGGQVAAPNALPTPEGATVETITVTIPGDTTDKTATGLLTLKGS